MMRAAPWRIGLLISITLLTNCLLFPRTGHAFSVLAHQAIVDHAWKRQLLPMIQRRFPNATEDELTDARAYARAGSHLPDLGYFPLGNRLFTNLLHYVRSGDFIARLITEARTPQEYAFALGVMAHYEGDTVGHPLATNLAVYGFRPQRSCRYEVGSAACPTEAINHTDENSSRWLTRVQVASGAMFFGAVAWGILDAIYFYRPETQLSLGETPNPPTSIGTLRLSPAVIDRAVGPGLSFRF